ncbi:MAG: DNA polymerase III subunit beta, partial [Tepidiformaceae bacterium]
MKVQVLQENLQRGLAIVSRAVAARNTLPIISNILFQTDGGRLKLVATDLDITICAWIGSKIDEEGATTIPSRLISDFVASLPPGTVNLEIPERGRQVKLECARNESTINTMDAEDFPRTQAVSGGASI